MKRGWTTGKTSECDSGIALICPDEQLKVLVEYKGDSLSITAWVRCVSSCEDTFAVSSVVSILCCWEIKS